jgi:Fe-S-cluster containining protein
MQNIDNERNTKIDNIINKVVKCDNCHSCCKHSSGFVLSHEVERLKKLKVPLQKVGNIHFMALNPDGTCPNLNDQNKCSMYEDRPIACRMFPLNLMDRQDFIKKWVFFSFCPTENQLLMDASGYVSNRLILMTTHELEKCFNRQEIEEMLEADRMVSQVDYLEVGMNNYFTVKSTSLNYYT